MPGPAAAAAQADAATAIHVEGGSAGSGPWSAASPPSQHLHGGAQAPRAELGVGKPSPPTATFLNALDALIPKILFSVFTESWIRVTSGARGSV